MEVLHKGKLLGGDIHRIFSDYYLSQNMTVQGLSKTYLHTDSKMWFDLHLAVEVGIQVRGRSERTMGNNTRIVGPGDVWFVGIFERHGYRVIEQPCEVAVLIASPTVLAGLVLPEMPNCNWMEIFALPPRERPQTTDDLRPTILDLAWRIQRSVAMDPGPEVLMRRLALIELLLLFMPRTRKRPARASQVPEGPARIAPAVELALENRRLVLHDEAAAACGMGRHQFRRAFQAVLGIPFAKFALHHRLEGAASEIAYTDAPTKAIAASWGFTDESHLSHAFAREYGCGPREYRRRHQTS
ncbi:MAG: AraC family transcriptional regulator [Lentisphaerae bacterium]|nr:AraC family transcriptional regulator [Lentisphaerota bacterium]